MAQGLDRLYELTPGTEEVKSWLSDIWRDHKLKIGICCVGILGLKYGVPNIRYFVQQSRSIYWNTKENMMPSDMLDFEFTVSLTDIDFWAHMNNAAYLRYAEVGRFAWFASSFKSNTDKKARDTALLGLVCPQTLSVQ